MALRLKRGTNAQRTAYTPEAGELIYVTDYTTAGVSPLWLGDGTTAGGIDVSATGGGGGGLTAVADDTTPELGGNLSLAGYEINGIGDIDIVGSITATGTISGTTFTGGTFNGSFIGDGSGLTGVIADGPFVGDLTGSVFSDDSVLIIDAISGKIYAKEIVNAGIVIENTIDNRIFNLQLNSASDLSANGADRGQIFFSRNDINGLQYEAVIGGGRGGIYFHVDETATFPQSTIMLLDGNGNLSLGSYSANAKLDVRGDAIITGGITGDLTGSVFADDSTVLVDAVAGKVFVDTVNDITDVAVTSPQTGQVLKWNGTHWTNQSDVSGGGGGGASAFTNIGIGADDSAIRLINEGESFLILGGTGVTTSSDAEGNITIDGFSGAFADLSSKPTTLTGYGITDAATSAQGALADTAIQPADLGNLVVTGSTIDTSDSSGFVFTPAVTMSSDLTVENDLTVSNVVYAERFVSNATGTPEIEAATNLNLTAGNAVIITSSPLRLASFTTAERDALAAQNGDIIYNTTLNKFQGYENGAWANLI